MRKSNPNTEILMHMLEKPRTYLCKCLDTQTYHIPISNPSVLLYVLEVETVPAHRPEGVS